MHRILNPQKNVSAEYHLKVHMYTNSFQAYMYMYV